MYFFRGFTKMQSAGRCTPSFFTLFARSGSNRDAANLLKQAPVIQDVPIEQDVEVRAATQYRVGHLSNDEYALYREHYERHLPDLPIPDLIVVLDASPQFLFARVQKRAIDLEQSVSLEYLTMLVETLREWSRQHAQSKILAISSEEMNEQENPAYEKTFLEAVEQELEN